MLTPGIKKKLAQQATLTICITAATATASPKGISAIQCLKKAYPDTICDITPSKISLCSGSEIAITLAISDPPITNGMHHDHYLKHLQSATLGDQLSQGYPSLYSGTTTGGLDPGRLRDEKFFQALYGVNAAEVSKNLTTIRWPDPATGRDITITKINKVAERLTEVGKEIATLPADELAAVANFSGGYKWRKIGGTERLSMHSFGIAIDLTVEGARYWRWNKGFVNLTTHLTKWLKRGKLSDKVIAAFEKQGFIWGGKWHHYDTMHFEYRPELFCGGRHPQDLYLEE